MREKSRLMAAAAFALVLIFAWGAWRPTTAQMVTKEIQLTEKLLDGYLAAQPKMAAAQEAEFESIAKAHGFASLDEYDTVEANILLVFDGIDDPKSKAFSEPPVQIKRKIDEINSDKSIAEADRKKALAELNEALKSARPIQFPANVELVRRYYDRLNAVLQQ
jgi:hypothetical protein